MIRAKRMLLCNRLEKIMEGRVDRIKAHTFHESVISDLKDIISEVESCLHMFDVESTIEKAQRQEPVDRGRCGRGSSHAHSGATGECLAFHCAWTSFSV